MAKNRISWKVVSFLLLTSVHSIFCISLLQAEESLEPEKKEDLTAKETVVLLHGLARSSSSMNKMEKALTHAGYAVCNISYPSTEHIISILAERHIVSSINRCISELEEPTGKLAEESIHFVTHSMGGILVRYLAKFQSAPFDPQLKIPRFGRVVMLSPPNNGSEVVDKLGEFWLFDLLNGPAGQELGTDSESVPRTLGPADFEVGIVTGRRTINFFLSLMIEGKDDGKVSIENAKLEGMADFLVLPATHPFIMKNNEAISQTIHFLQEGRFLPSN